MIRPNLSEWTVVVVGQWNPAVFSPEWVASHLLQVNPIETHLAMGPLGGGVRYQSPTLVVIPQADRLIIGARNSTESCLAQMEAAAQRVLRLLSHTPIQGVGINYGFIENDPSVDLIQTFDIRDSGALAENGLAARRTVIIREIDLAQVVLKLKLSYAEGQVGLHFNYNYAATSADAGADLLTGKAQECRNKTSDILSTIFELEGEEVN